MISHLLFKKRYRYSINIKPKADSHVWHFMGYIVQHHRLYSDIPFIFNGMQFSEIYIPGSVTRLCWSI